MLKQRPLVTFPGCPTSDLRAMCRGFHVPCKLPLLNYRAGSAGAAAAEMRRKQLLPPVVR
ncbi:hypothetical protein DIPPA_12295 [Diplonema papillatum]|nr:hypothetical protein DIPPA_12295 [Diplonema papillatum]